MDVLKDDSGWNQPNTDEKRPGGEWQPSDSEMPSGNGWQPSDSGMPSGNGAPLNSFRNPPNAMAIAAFSCGAASLLMLCLGGSPVLGALGIIFALLSRTDKMSRPAQIGFGLSIGGLTIFTLSLIAAVSVLSATGTLSRIMTEAQGIDWNDPYAIQQFTYDIQDDYTQMMENIWNELPMSGYSGNGSVSPSARGNTGSGSTNTGIGNGGVTASINRDAETSVQDVAQYPVADNQGSGGIEPDIAVAHADSGTAM